MTIKTGYQAVHNLAEAEIKLLEVKEYIQESIHNSGEHFQSERQNRVVEIDLIQKEIKEIMKWFLR